MFASRSSCAHACTLRDVVGACGHNPDALETHSCPGNANQKFQSWKISSSRCIHGGQPDFCFPWDACSAGSHPQARMKTTTFDVTNLVYHSALLIKIDTGSVVVVCLGFWAVLLSNYHKDWTKAGHRCNAFC